MCKAARHGMTVMTSISKNVFSFMGFAFVDDADLIAGADDVNTTGPEMIACFQALMTCWNGGVRATGGLIAPEKTRWFLLSFYQDDLDWQYHTKDTLPGNITLPDQNGDLYTVTREEPTSAHTSLGMELTLCGYNAVQGVKTADAAQLFASKMGTAKCDKTSCLNAFNTSFMPSLSYTMIATQFTEHQWKKIISPAIQATLNASGVVRNLAHAIL